MRPATRWTALSAWALRASVAVLLVAAFVLLSRHRQRAAPRELPAPRADRWLAELVERSPRTGRPVHDVEELIGLLPDELRRNYTFVHGTRSPHALSSERGPSPVDADYPRIILFSRDGRRLLALTGDPARPGYDIVEAITYSDETARFVATRYVLPAAVERDPTLAAQRAENGTPNPTRCRRCHGEGDAARPLFDSYPLWPGFYGSVLDTFPPGSPDLARYRHFIESRRHRETGPYRLLHVADSSPLWPYADPERFDPDATAASYAELRRSPNTRLGMALSELNRKRIAQKLAARPDYPRYRHGLIAMLLGCAPPPLSREEYARVEELIAADNAARVRQLGFSPPGPRGRPLSMAEVGMGPQVTRLLYTARLLGVDATQLSLGIDENPLGFYDGALDRELDGRSFYLVEDWALELLRRLAVEDSRFSPYFVPRRLFGDDEPFGEKLDLRAATAACGLLLEEQRRHGAPLPALPEGWLERLDGD